MDDERFVELASQVEMPIEVLDLLFARRVLLEPIEPRFTDPNTLGPSAHLFDFRPRFLPRTLGIVRVNARCRKEVQLTGAQLESRLRRNHVRPDDDHPLHTRLPRAREDRRAVAVEALPVKVGVAVGDHPQTLAERPWGVRV